jgi:hypothetical protein
MAALGLSLQTVGMTIQTFSGNTDGRLELENTNTTSILSIMLSIEKYC